MGGSVRGEVESKADERGRWRQTRFNSNGVMGIRSATTPKDSAEWGQFIMLINAQGTKKKREGAKVKRMIQRPSRIAQYSKVKHFG